MKFISFFLFIITILMSCTSSEVEKKEAELRRKELELREREVSLKEKEMQQPSNSKDATASIPVSTQEYKPIEEAKYLFVVIETNEPQIKQREKPSVKSSSFVEDYLPPPVTEYEKYTVPRFYTYKSDVIEVQDYNEDKKYREIDKFEKSVRQSLRQVNFNLNMENNSGMGEPVSYGMEATIISKKAYVFDTYQAASEKRN